MDRDETIAALDAGADAELAPTYEARELAIVKLRPGRWRRAWERIVRWFRGRDDKAIATAGMGVMSRRQHREMVAFARESGNGAMLECLRRK